MMNEREHRALVPDPPRAVPRWFYLWRVRSMVFCGVLFFSLGIGLGVGLPLCFYVLGGCVLPTVDFDLDRTHASSTAVITAKQLLAYTKVNGWHPWKMSFQFTTSDGRTVDGTGYTLDPSVGAKVEGEPLAVEYDPVDPSRARPAGGIASLFPLWAYGLTLALLGPELVIGAGLLLLAWSRTHSERLLLAYGPGIDAEVVDVRRVSYIHFGSKSPYDVHYRFYDHRGLEVIGKDRTYHYGWAETLKPGDKVGVVYHPNAPEANALYLHGSDVGSEGL